jgi:hypothetical protein
LDARLKQMRSASPVDWQNDEKKFKTVAEVSLLLVDTYLAQDEEDLKKNLFSAKLHLRGVLKKAEVCPHTRFPSFRPDTKLDDYT